MLNDPKSFISLIRKNLDNQLNTVVYFDFPYADYTFGNQVIWNVVYEHRSWFSKASLRYLMEQCGFEVLNIGLSWNDEFIYVEAKPDPNYSPVSTSDAEVKKLESIIDKFNAAYSQVLDDSKQKIAQIKAESKRVIGWGAGARGISFFNLFDLKQDVPYIVDINEKRQGKYLPGSGQQIVSPNFIVEYQPDLIIITNPTYAQEIIQHTKEMGVEADFWVL